MPTLLEVNRQLHFETIMKMAANLAAETARLALTQGDLPQVAEAADSVRQARQFMEIRVKQILESYEAASNHHQ